MNIIELECKELLGKIEFNKLSDKKVLVTGASGLIGVYLVSCLSEISKFYNVKIYNVKTCVNISINCCTYTFAHLKRPL